MDAFETAVRKAIDSSLRTTIKGYITEFAEVLTNKVNSEKNLKAEQIVDLWNDLAKDLVVKPGARKAKKEEKEADPSVPSCEHVFTKGDRKDKQCCEKISKNSETKKFCSKHYKQNETPEEKKKGGKKSECDGSCCPYVLKKGDREGEECGKNTTKGSKFCSKHKGDSKDKKKDKKKDSKKAKKEKKDKKEDKDESSKVKAKPIKTGDLKGMCYFEHEDVKFVFETKSKIVKGTMGEEGKLVELTSDQVTFIESMPPFQLEKKEEVVVEEKKVKKSDSKKSEKKEEADEESEESEEADEESEESEEADEESEEEEEVDEEESENEEADE